MLLTWHFEFKKQFQKLPKTRLQYSRHLQWKRVRASLLNQSVSYILTTFYSSTNRLITRLKAWRNMSWPRSSQAGRSRVSGKELTASFAFAPSENTFFSARDSPIISLSTFLDSALFFISKLFLTKPRFFSLNFSWLCPLLSLLTFLERFA